MSKEKTGQEEIKGTEREKRKKARSVALCIGGTMLALALAICVFLKCIYPGDQDVPMSEAGVELCGYTGIDITMEDTAVTQEDVEEYAAFAVQNYNLNARSDRTVVEEGDTVYVVARLYDSEGNPLNEYDPKGSPVTDHNFEGFVTAGDDTDIGKNLAGAEAGSVLDVPITLPDPYEYNGMLSGADAVEQVSVLYIKGDVELSLDTLTDEQAGLIFDVDGVDGFYAYIRNMLEEQNEGNRRATAYRVICEYLLGNCRVKPFPGLELENRVDRQVSELEEMCGNYYGMTLEEYCGQIGMTVEEYRKDVEEHTKESLTLELIFNAIGDAEGITYDEVEYQKYVDGVVEGAGYENADALYAEYGEDYVRNAFRTEYVVDWLIDNADITYMEAGE